MTEPSQHPPDSRFIEAITRHQPVLEAFCHANLARREDAWEVLQKTNLKLWHKASDWDPETEFLPWAFAVARFTILSHFRDLSRDRLIFDSDVIHSMAAETECFASELHERRIALGNCLEKLSPEHRSLLDAHYHQGKSLKQIAAESRRGESAMKMIMLRLRRSLGDCIQQQLAKAHP